MGVVSVVGVGLGVWLGIGAGRVVVVGVVRMVWGYVCGLCIGIGL